MSPGGTARVGAEARVRIHSVRVRRRPTKDPPAFRREKFGGPRSGSEIWKSARRRLPCFYGYSAVNHVRVRTAYRCRAYPDEAQQQVLARTFGCVRVVWNRTLATRKARYAHRTQVDCPTRTPTGRFDRTEENTRIPVDPLNEVSSVPLQQHRPCGTSTRSVPSLLREAGPVPPGSNPAGESSPRPTPGRRSRWREGELTLAKTATPLRVAWSWPDIDPVTPLDPTTVTGSRDPAGRWFVTLHAATSRNRRRCLIHPECRRCRPWHQPFPRDQPPGTDPPPPPPGTQGAKLGAVSAAPGPEGTKNRAKAKPKVARPTARSVTPPGLPAPRHHPPCPHPDTIVVEDLDVAGMVRNRKLAQSDLGLRLGRVPRSLHTSAARYGPDLAVVGRSYPTSKTCSACGHLLAGPESFDEALDVPVLPHPARPGCQRGEEHPCGRSCRSPGCPRAMPAEPTSDIPVGPGAVGCETGTPGREPRNSRPSERGVVTTLEPVSGVR